MFSQRKSGPCLLMEVAPPETPIILFKNLRVCGDCHAATKKLSRQSFREESLLEMQSVARLFKWKMLLQRLLLICFQFLQDDILH